MSTCWHVDFTDAVNWIHVSLCREWAVLFTYSTNKSSRNHLATMNQENKHTLRCLSKCLIIHWFIYYSVCLLRGSEIYRLSCSHQTSWADWGPHEGPFKQRRCNISPRVKHQFYFGHHKAVFKNNWEPTAVDSWKWSWGALVWRREMLWRLSNKIAAVDPKKAVWEQRVIEVVKWTWGRRTLDPVKLTAVPEFWECVSGYLGKLPLCTVCQLTLCTKPATELGHFFLFSVFFFFFILSNSICWVQSLQDQLKYMISKCPFFVHLIQTFH